MAPGATPPPSVSARLAEALTLWRGVVLDGLEIDPSWRSDVTRLEELRVSVLERRIEADLVLGRHSELVGELEALVRIHPLHEGLQGQLMLALYRSGRQADALGVYRRTRQILAEELGIDPSPALQDLELAILKQSPELESPSDEGGAAVVADGAGTSTVLPLVLPLPGRLAVGPAVGVIGRGAEIQAIADAYKRVAGAKGERCFSSRGGRSGQDHARGRSGPRRLRGGGVCALRALRGGSRHPLPVLCRGSGYYISHAPVDQLLGHIEAHGSELARLVPALSRRVPDLPASKATDSDAERYLLFSATVGLLAMVAELQPVVLVLDDLQWADKGSLLLLRHLSAAEHDMRVLVLATYRDSELAHADALRDTLGVMRRQRGVSGVGLSGLDDSSVVSFLEAAAGHTLDDAGVDLAHAVYRETDGNPFFVSEVLRHLRETGAISRMPPADGWPRTLWKRWPCPTACAR